MSAEQWELDQIKAVIKTLPPELEEATNELAEHMRMQIRIAGEPVGLLALALVGAEAAAS